MFQWHEFSFLNFCSEPLPQLMSPDRDLRVRSCKGLDALLCSIHIHSHAALLIWSSVTPHNDKPLPTPTLSSECKTVWLMFPTVTLLSESWPRRRRGEWGTLTSVMSWDKDTQSLDPTQYLPVQSWVCFYSAAHRRHYFCVFSVRINCREKVRVTLICIWSGSIDTARLWATVWHRSAAGKCRPASIKQSAAGQLRIAELNEAGYFMQTGLFILLVEFFFCFF